MKKWTYLLGSVFFASAAWAQPAKFPDHPIRFIVPFAPGGGVDTVARLVAKQLGQNLAVPVIVENRAGGNGTVGGQAVKTAAPDGYTLLYSAATHVLTRQIMSKPPYDPVTDFMPVARVGEAPLMMVISPALPQQKLSEVLAAAKKNPDQWTAALPALGAPSHVATLLMASQGNLTLTTTAYKGTAPALVDVAGGHTQILLDSIISILPMAKSGRVKPIVVTSAKRSALAPDVPTAVESGYPKLVHVSWQGVWAPKGTSAERVEFLNSALNQAVTELDKSGAFTTVGIEGVAETVDQFKKFIDADVSRGTELLKGAGFKPE